MMERSLGFGTSLVMMAIPPEHGRINSERIDDLTFFNRVLIWNMWVLASPMMLSASSLCIGIMACFLEGPLVVNWTFLALLVCWPKAALILRAFATFDTI